MLLEPRNPLLEPVTVMTEKQITERAARYASALGIAPGQLPTVAEFRVLQRLLELDTQARLLIKKRNHHAKTWASDRRSKGSQALEPKHGLFIED